MKKRPLSITIIAWVFVAACSVGLIYHVLPRAGGVGDQTLREQGVTWVLGVRLLGVVGGLYLLGGCNWARWLLVLWLGYHVILSGLHSPLKLTVHGVLFAMLLWLLFRAPASDYFRRRAVKGEGATPAPSQ